MSRQPPREVLPLAITQMGSPAFQHPLEILGASTFGDCYPEEDESFSVGPGR
jgi:hypothetical protein